VYAVTRTGLAPEIIWFETRDEDLESRNSSAPTFPPSKNSLKAWKSDYDIKPLDAHNLQRPETVESLFVMWRITGDPLYREWGWKIFKAFETHAKVNGGGYTSLDDVNSIPPTRRDNMESFWLVSLTSTLGLSQSSTRFALSKLN
jgi:endoplasmic reticulum Man9GlcNAc2 1,2-alpha-mannosidase